MGGNVKNNNTDGRKCNQIIDEVDVTNDALTSRAGLALFVRYLRNIALFPYLEQLFSRYAKAGKGKPLLRFLSNCSAF